MSQSIASSSAQVPYFTGLPASQNYEISDQLKDPRQEKYSRDNSLYNYADDESLIYSDLATQNSQPIVSETPFKPKLGVLQLNYEYPTIKGDVDCPDSYDYDVLYRPVKSLCFEACKQGILTEELKDQLREAVLDLKAQGVSGIGGSCGFMIHFQEFVKEVAAETPVFLSPLVQLPVISCAFCKASQTIIMTSNGTVLDPLRELIRDECNVDINRFHIVGCEDIPGFEAVALGQKIDYDLVEPGIVARAQEALKQYPGSKCILFECTQLGPFSAAVRRATGLPVFDAITNCDFFIASAKNQHF